MCHKSVVGDDTACFFSFPCRHDKKTPVVRSHPLDRTCSQLKYRNCKDNSNSMSNYKKTLKIVILGDSGYVAMANAKRPERWTTDSWSRDTLRLCGTFTSWCSGLGARMAILCFLVVTLFHCCTILTKQTIFSAFLVSKESERHR